MAIATNAGEISLPSRPSTTASMSVIVGSTVLAGGMAVLGSTPVRAGALVGLLTLLAAVVVRRPVLLNSTGMSLAGGLALLSVSNAGIPASPGGFATPAPSLLVALFAYLLFGHAFVRQKVHQQIVRRSDLVAEAALAGAAVTVAVQARVAGSATGSAAAVLALMAVLVGLDIALATVGVRALVDPAEPTHAIVITVAAVSMAAGHMMAVTGDRDGGTITRSSIAVAIGILVLALGEIHIALDGRTSTPSLEPAAFSRGHAALIVAWVVMSPVVLAAGTVGLLDVPTSVTITLVVTAVILSTHLVSLLGERASGEHLATHDPLTDLANRSLLMDRVERAIAHAYRAGTPVGVLYINLDRFKDVNESLGHRAGDELLEATAKRLRRVSREEDTVARMGGDEFAVLLPHLGQPDDMVIIAQRFLAALEPPVELGERLLRNPASVGIAVYPEDGATPVDLLAAADSAMHRAKENGGTRFEVFNPEMSVELVVQSETETELLAAMDDDQLVLHYQPVVDARNGLTIGAEALIRWQHPERGLLSPAAFIPIAERSDLIVDVGGWVIDRACRELRIWAQRGFADRSIAVNVSARHFEHDLVSTVTRALRAWNVEPRNLVIELTESTAADDIGHVADVLHELRQLGVRVAIDDFGTGYCGLQYLVDLPVSSLKIDRSFVTAMTPKSAAIVAATIAMASTLGLVVVAEGIETPEQRRFIERSGCDQLQGFFLGRPMPAVEMLERFESERAQRSAAPAHFTSEPMNVETYAVGSS